MKKSVSILLASLLAFSMLLPATFTVSAASTDVLSGKSVLVTGDDIVYNGDGSWGARLKDNYGMKVTSTAPRSGVSISDWRKESSGVIHKQITGCGERSFDYVLLHGGMADMEKQVGSDPSPEAIEGVALGVIKPSEFDLDLTPEIVAGMEAVNFSAGVERLLLAAITKYEGARIGFIINYATPENKCVNAREPERYWEVVRQLCDKWGIPYLDLCAGKTADGKSYSYDILNVKDASSPYMSKNKKSLSAAGYDVITPYIAEWMTTIKPYNLKSAMATAVTTTRRTGKTLPTSTTTTTTGKATTSTIATASASANTETTTTTKDKNSGNVISAGEAQIVTRKTTTTAPTQPTVTEPEGVGDTVKLVLIVCASVVVLVIAAIVTVLIVRSRKK